MKDLKHCVFRDKLNFQQQIEMEAVNLSQENPLSSEPVGKLLFKISLPAITAQIINVLYNMVDRMFIGHIPEV